MFQLIIKQTVIQYNVVLTIDRIKLFKYIYILFLVTKEKNAETYLGKKNMFRTFLMTKFK